MNQIQYSKWKLIFSSCHILTMPWLLSIFIFASLLYTFFYIYLNFLYQVILLCYPFLWLKLYLHMFKQRRSKLGKHHEKKRMWSLELFQILILAGCHLLVLLEFWVLSHRFLWYSSYNFSSLICLCLCSPMIHQCDQIDAHNHCFCHVAIVYIVIYGLNLCANFRNFIC